MNRPFNLIHFVKMPSFVPLKTMVGRLSPFLLLLRALFQGGISLLADQKKLVYSSPKTRNFNNIHQKTNENGHLKMGEILQKGDFLLNLHFFSGPCFKIRGFFKTYLFWGKKIVDKRFQSPAFFNPVPAVVDERPKVSSCDESHQKPPTIWAATESCFTPRKTNMSPENQWLEDVFPIKILPS